MEKTSMHFIILKLFYFLNAFINALSKSVIILVRFKLWFWHNISKTFSYVFCFWSGSIENRLIGQKCRELSIFVWIWFAIKLIIFILNCSLWVLSFSVYNFFKLCATFGSSAATGWIQSKNYIHNKIILFFKFGF